MMRPRMFLKTSSLLLPSHNSLGASKRIGLHVLCGYRLASTLPPAPAARKHGGVSSAGQNMEQPVSDCSIASCGTKPKRVITTLDPSRLDSSCFIDISNIISPRIYQAPPHKRLLLLEMPYIVTKRKPYKPFPAGTHGFLYFYTNPLDPLESQLRFRVTESNNPESFVQGTDLMYGPGLPFHVRLSKIARSPKLERLRQFLVQEGLVDEAHLAELKQRPAVRQKKRPKRPITRLDQPFIYDYTAKWFSLTVCAPRSQRFLYQLHSPLRSGEQHRGIVLYKKGALECRFEQSTLPEHTGRRVVLMRLLKILEPPVAIDNLPPGTDTTMPAEGELFTRGGRVWQKDLDRPSGNNVGLRMLFDIDAEEKASR